MVSEENAGTELQKFSCHPGSPVTRSDTSQQRQAYPSGSFHLRPGAPVKPAEIVRQPTRDDGAPFRQATDTYIPSYAPAHSPARRSQRGRPPPRHSQSQVRHDSPLRHTRSPPRRGGSPPRRSRSPPPRSHPSDRWQPPPPHRRPSVNREYPNRLPPPGPPVLPSLPGPAVMPSLPNPTVTCEHKTNFDIHHGKGRCDVCSKQAQPTFTCRRCRTMMCRPCQRRLVPKHSLKRRYGKRPGMDGYQAPNKDYGRYPGPRE